MNNITTRQIRYRLDEALKSINDVGVTKNAKIRELWAIMSDIELWMEDVEIRLKAQESKPFITSTSSIDDREKQADYLPGPWPRSGA